MSTPSFIIVAQRFDQYGNPLPIQNVMQDNNGNYLIPPVITGETINLFGVVNGTDHSTTYSQWGYQLGSSPIANLGYGPGESNPLVLQSTDSGKTGLIQLQLYYPNAYIPSITLTQNFIVSAPTALTYNQSNCGQVIALYNNDPITIDPTGIKSSFSIKFVSVGADPKVISSSLSIQGFTPNSVTNSITLPNDGDMVEFHYDPNSNLLQVTDKNVASAATVVNNSSTPVYKPAPEVVSTNSNNFVDFGSAGDHHTFLQLTNPSSTITVHPDSYWTGTDHYYDNNFNPLNPGPMPIGGSATFCLATAGAQATFVASPGVIIMTPSSLVMNVQNGLSTIVKVAPNVWRLEGHIV